MDIDTERLKKRWDGRSEYVIDGETTYRVFTPNGPEEPVFVPQSTAGMYDQTSTGFVQAQEPKNPLGKQRQTPKVKQKVADVSHPDK